MIQKKHWLTIARILALILVIGISVFVYSIRDQVEEFAIYGYPGIFIISFLANATVLLPAPGIAVVFAMGAIFNPFLVGLAAGAGGTLGEMSGYLAGFSGQAVIERADIYDRMVSWMKRNGNLTILLLAAIPNPFFDLTGIAAGALKMPVARFLFWCFLGITFKMTLFALLGSASLTKIFNP
ncbi:VTT domain-containing protein [Chloroflexota bacterium]